VSTPPSNFPASGTPSRFGYATGLGCRECGQSYPIGSSHVCAECFGPLEVRYAKNADTMLERLAAENRDDEVVCLVSSDVALRGTSGREVQKQSSATFLGDLEAVTHSENPPHHLRDTLDPETREKLERMRRGGG